MLMVRLYANHASIRSDGVLDEAAGDSRSISVEANSHHEHLLFAPSLGGLWKGRLIRRSLRNEQARALSSAQRALPKLRAGFSRRADGRRAACSEM